MAINGDQLATGMESGVFRFGLFTLHAATRELRREDVLIRVQSQPAQVLVYLVEHAGQVVSREELRSAVWGNETFVDFERGLNFCISQIRSVLRDDPAQPTFIRTIPKRGYQFIAPVERISPQLPEKQKTPSVSRVSVRAMAVGALLLAVALGLAVGLWIKSRSNGPPIIAVLRFDNETSNPDLTRFSDGLTDNVVEQLTSRSNGHYSVIGNAQILRLPRDQRDISAIASSLHASFVVMGQVQGHGDQTRILAHLIRLPGQTHIWVTRMDRELADPLNLESEAAQKIAAEFSSRVTADASGGASPKTTSH